MAEIEDRTQEVPSPALGASEQTTREAPGDSVSRAQDSATEGAGNAFREGFLEEEPLLAVLGQGRQWR